MSWSYCSSNRRCPICGGKTPDCRFDPNGAVHCLHTHDKAVLGWIYVGPSGTEWGMYVEEAALDRPRGFRPGKQDRPAPAGPAKPKKPDTTVTRDLYFAHSPKIIDEGERKDLRILEERLGLPGWAFQHFDTRRCDGFDGYAAFGYPEYDAAGKLTSFVVRSKDGSKRAYGPRGVNYPDDFAALPGPIYLPEGWTDAVALRAMGFASISRPASSAGQEIIAKLLQGEAREPIVLGENDRKADGTWPGREGAVKLASYLSQALGRPIRIAFPGQGKKDVRAWFNDWYRPDLESSLDLGQHFPGELVYETIDARTAGNAPGVPVQARGGDGAAETPEQVAALQARLKAIADEEAEAARARETAAAECIRKARADHGRYECKNCVRLVLRHLETGNPTLIDRRCEKWTCDGCRRYLIQRELLSLTHHMGEADELHEGYVTRRCWEAAQRQMQRAGAQYVRIREERENGFVWYVVATRAFRGSIPTVRDTALATLSLLLNAWHGVRRPLSTSHGWRLPREEGPVAYERVGKAATMSMRTLMEIAADVGATVVPVRSKRDGVLRKMVLTRLEGWDRDTSDRVCSNLMLGEVLPEIDLSPTFGQPTTPDVSILTAFDGSLTFCFSS